MFILQASNHHWDIYGSVPPFFCSSISCLPWQICEFFICSLVALNTCFTFLVCFNEVRIFNEFFSPIIIYKFLQISVMDLYVVTAWYLKLLISLVICSFKLHLCGQADFLLTLICAAVDCYCCSFSCCKVRGSSTPFE